MYACMQILFLVMYTQSDAAQLLVVIISLCLTMEWCCFSHVLTCIQRMGLSMHDKIHTLRDQVTHEADYIYCKTFLTSQSLLFAC